MIYKLLFTGLARKCLSPLVLPVCLCTQRIMRAFQPANTRIPANLTVMVLFILEIDTELRYNEI